MYRWVVLPVFLLICSNLSSQVIINMRRDTLREEAGFTTFEEILFFSREDSSYSSENCKVRAYYNSGVLMEEYVTMKEFKNGDYRSYYPNGNIKEIYSNVNGHRSGAYILFHSNGKKNIAGRYKLYKAFPVFRYNRDTTIKYDSLTGKTTSIIAISPKSTEIKVGYWYYWDSVGKLEKREIWKEGKLVK